MAERNPYYVSRTTSNAGLILLGHKRFCYTDHLKHFMIINKYAFNYL